MDWRNTEFEDPYTRLERLESAMAAMGSTFEGASAHIRHVTAVINHHTETIQRLEQRIQTLEFRIRQCERRQEFLP